MRLSRLEEDIAKEKDPEARKRLQALLEKRKARRREIVQKAKKTAEETVKDIFNPDQTPEEQRSSGIFVLIVLAILVILFIWFIIGEIF